MKRQQEGPRGFQLMDEEPSGDPAAPISFTTFVLSLSASALLHLGVRPDEGLGLPLEEGAPEVDLGACRQTIDILEMLQRKTRGNLSEAEARLLESVLHDLHLRFVAAERARRGAPR